MASPSHSSKFSQSPGETHQTPVAARLVPQDQKCLGPFQYTRNPANLALTMIYTGLASLANVLSFACSFCRLYCSLCSVA
jgi:hypothetical protein